MTEDFVAGIIFVFVMVFILAYPVWEFLSFKRINSKLDKILSIIEKKPN